MNIKHCLIIPCAAPKIGGKSVEAYDMYLGYMMQVMRQFSKADVLSNFNVFFLSAKLGLIKSTDLIDDYDFQMAKDISPEAYAQIHKGKATNLLNKYLGKGVKCYVALSKPYLKAWSLMDIATLPKFAVTYTHEISRGSGDNRGCLRAILNQHINPIKFDHVFFKSGCSNENEYVGIRNAGSCVGTSLAYLGKGKLSALQHIKESVQSDRPFFVDNGLITSLTKNKALDVPGVFSQYIELVKSIRGNCKSLSVVVPDDPFSQDNALKIIKDNIKNIRWLAKRCNVLIAFHKPTDRSVEEQLGLVHSIIGDMPFTAAFPCKDSNEARFRLSIADIESALRFKIPNENPEINDRLIKKVHFFALGESSGKPCAERLDLVERYGIESQLDVTRFASIFGYKNKKKNCEVREPRVGTEECIKVKKELSQTYVIGENHCAGYDVGDEHSASLKVKSFKNLSRDERIALWDDIFPKLSANETNGSTEIDKKVWVEITASETGFEPLGNQQVKTEPVFRKRFIYESLVQPSPSDVRAKSISNILSEEGSFSQQVFSFALIDTPESIESLKVLKMAEKNGRLVIDGKAA